MGERVVFTIARWAFRYSVDIRKTTSRYNRPNGLFTCIRQPAGSVWLTNNGRTRKRRSLTIVRTGLVDGERPNGLPSIRSKRVRTRTLRTRNLGGDGSTDGTTFCSLFLLIPFAFGSGGRKSQSCFRVFFRYARVGHRRNSER